MGLLPDSLKGAFANVTDVAKQAAITQAEGLARGAFGIPSELAAAAPVAAPAPPSASPSQVASLPPESKEPRSGGLMAFVRQYKRALLIAGAVVAALVVYKAMRRKR